MRKYLLGSLSWLAYARIMATQVTVLLGWLALHEWLWRAGLRRYESYGG